MPLFPPEVEIFVRAVGSFFADWWWVILPPVLLFTLLDVWLFYVRWRWFLSQEWVLMEVRLPQIVERTPKAMEQVFAGLHGIWDDTYTRFPERWLHGVQPLHFTCELVSVNGESHFYFRMLAKFKNLLESHVWAQYPTAEIQEVEDYVQNIPQDVPNNDWELWGTEFTLTKPDVYPIRTYPYFEEIVEERRLDPLSAVLEVMGSLKEGEQMWIQILVSPVMEENWKKAGLAEVSKLVSRQDQKKSKPTGSIVGSVTGEMTLLARNIPGALTPGGLTGSAAKTPVRPEREPPPSLMMHLTPGERAVVEAIEENVAKLGFKTGVRVLYFGRRDVYNSGNIAAIFGAIRQFNTQHLNGFRPDKRTMPKHFYFFKKQKHYFRKRRLVRLYRLRFPTLPWFTFNTEELATIFHLPGTMVAPAPLVPRIEAKRGEPPATLPRA